MSDFTNIDDDEDEIVDDIKDDFKKTCFLVVGTVNRKSGKYSRVVMVNKWIWMTEPQLRVIYKPILEYLQQEKGFKEKGKGIVEVDLTEQECRDYLLSLGMIENESLRSADTLIRK